MTDEPKGRWDAFIWSRTAIWIAALLGLFLVAGTQDPVASEPWVIDLTHEFGSITDVWARWDSAWFLGIAEHGYEFRDGAAAFYPLYPALIAALGRVLLDHYILAGLIISLVSCAVAFRLLDTLGRRLVGPAQAARAVLFLAVFPMSFFLQAVYSEALFLALSLAAFLLAERGRFAWAGSAAGLALLTRPLGLALLPALLLLAIRSERRRRDVAYLTIAPALFLVYPAFLWWQVGEPFAFMKVEDLWFRDISPLGPIGGLWDAGHAAWAGILQLTVGSQEHWYWTPENPAGVAARNLEYTAYLALFVWLSIVAWRRLGAPYGLYCALSLAVPLSMPAVTYPLLSLPRFGLVLFPIYLALASLTEQRPRLATAVVGTSAILLGASVVRWALWQFVA